MHPPEFHPVGNAGVIQTVRPKFLANVHCSTLSPVPSAFLTDLNPSHKHDILAANIHNLNFFASFELFKSLLNFVA